jgi:hypothetical protein
MSALKLNILFILVKYLCFVNGVFFFYYFKLFTIQNVLMM